jgi:DNA-binding LacI/PurR family transcriptional regulator/DNA-binding transcriptional regulator YhcF (GntR family)
MPLPHGRATAVIKTKSAIPVTRQLLTILTKEIEQGAYAAGERFPSERDIAQQYGLSRASVREAVAQMIARGLLVRTNGRGTFVVDRAAGAPGVHATGKHLGFWIDETVFHFAEPGYNQILSGFAEVCRSTGCELDFYPVSDQSKFHPEQDSGPGHLAGSVIVGGLSRGWMDRLSGLEKPVILVDLLNSTDGVSVSIDYAAGTRWAIDYLVGLGHRDIGFIGFPNSEKYILYWQSLEAHRICYRPQYVEFFDSSDLRPGMFAGYRAMRQLIARAGQRPTAVLITNDFAALGAMEALAVAQVSVPDDISIVGYDNFGQGSTSLTTIRSDLMEVGRLAARSLLQWIDTGRAPNQRTTVPVELIVRASTAAPPDTAARVPADLEKAGAESTVRPLNP